MFGFLFSFLKNKKAPPSIKKTRRYPVVPLPFIRTNLREPLADISCRKTSLKDLSITLPYTFFVYFSRIPISSAVTGGPVRAYLPLPTGFSSGSCKKQFIPATPKPSSICLSSFPLSKSFHSHAVFQSPHCLILSIIAGMNGNFSVKFQ